MKLLANENIPVSSIALLRQANHNVRSLTEEFPGATDEHVLALAREDGRVLVTFDRDYGGLIFGRGLPAPRGLIYLRFAPHTPTEPAEILLALFAQEGIKIYEHFLVVERDNVRARPFTKPPAV